MTSRNRSRRSVLAVPGSSRKMIDKAKGLPADEIFLDLEDAVAPLAKQAARESIGDALAEDGWGKQVKVVRVNDWTTEWTYADVVEVVGRAGAHLDAILLPKVPDASHVQALDLLLTQVEKANGLEVGKIGIEPQIENAIGLTNIDAIATASPRVEALVFGPADFMASLNMRTLVVGEQPDGYDRGDAYHHLLMTILMAARGRTASRPSTGRTCRSATSRLSLGRLRERQRSVSTASGFCTPRRSRRPTRCSVRANPITTVRNSSWTRTRSTPRLPGEGGAPSCSATR